jgi:hypothetical protein
MREFAQWLKQQVVPIGLLALLGGDAARQATTNRQAPLPQLRPSPWQEQEPLLPKPGR